MAKSIIIINHQTTYSVEDSKMEELFKWLDKHGKLIDYVEND